MIRHDMVKLLGDVGIYALRVIEAGRAIYLTTNTFSIKSTEAIHWEHNEEGIVDHNL